MNRYWIVIAAMPLALLNTGCTSQNASAAANREPVPVRVYRAETIHFTDDSVGWLKGTVGPSITVIAISVGWLIGGLIVTESVFSYPGLGRLVLYGVQRRDIPLIQATVLLIVVIYGIANLIADILYAVLNPRIRYR